RQPSLTATDRTRPLAPQRCRPPVPTTAVSEQATTSSTDAADRSAVGRRLSSSSARIAPASRSVAIRRTGVFMGRAACHRSTAAARRCGRSVVGLSSKPGAAATTGRCTGGIRASVKGAGARQGEAMILLALALQLFLSCLALLLGQLQEAL